LEITLMSISLPLAQMTVEEKLQVMEVIWDDLRRHPDALQPPDWHGKALDAIEASIERGEETFDDWEKAKQRIRDNLA
jgi:Putative addiction module component